MFFKPKRLGHFCTAVSFSFFKKNNPASCLSEFITPYGPLVELNMP